MWFMSWQPEVPTYWLDSVSLARLGSTTKVGSKPVSEGAVVTIPTLPNIGRSNLGTLPSVLLTEEQVHSLVLAGDVGSDVNCLTCDRTCVGCGQPRVGVLAQCAVTSAATLPEPYRLSSTLADDRWRNLGSDEDVSQVLRAGEGCHGREGHVLLGMSVPVQETLMAMSDEFGDCRESFVKGERENDSVVRGPGDFLESAVSAQQSHSVKS